MDAEVSKMVAEEFAKLVVEVDGPNAGLGAPAAAAGAYAGAQYDDGDPNNQISDRAKLAASCAAYLAAYDLSISGAQR